MRTPKVTATDFVIAWQTSNTRNDVALKLGRNILLLVAVLIGFLNGLLRRK